jgi:hypothetical protein
MDKKSKKDIKRSFLKQGLIKQSNDKNEILANYAKMKLRIPLDKLSREIIDNLPDTEVESKIYARILETINFVERNEKRKDEITIIEELPEAQKLIYYSVILDDEIFNGGFFQYYLNYAGVYALETVHSLRLLRSPKIIDLLEKSIGAFMICIDSGFDLWFGAISRWHEKSSKLNKQYYLRKAGNSTFDTLDQEYYLIRDEFGKKRIEFIRANPDQYVM